MKRCLFPGSFDPFTKGHEVIVAQALTLFDEVVIGVGINSKKQGLFATDKKITHIRALFLAHKNVRVESFQKLTVAFCKDIGATHIVRGLRDAKDFEYERSIGHMNHSISGIDTVFFLTAQAHSATNSSIIREMYQNGADITPFVTKPELLV